MMRNALESLVAEMAGLATTDHRRRDFELSKAAQAGQRGDESGKNSGVLCGSEQRRGWLKDRVEGRRRQFRLLPEPLS